MFTKRRKLMIYGAGTVLLLFALLLNSIPAALGYDANTGGAVAWLVAEAEPVTFASTTQAIYSCANITELPQSECETLVALYNSTNGPEWAKQRGWLVTNTPCSWYGITCQDGHVRELNFNTNRLNGPLPPAIGNLTALSKLILSGNRLNGPLPLELGNLTNLTELTLIGNGLNGSIPAELGRLTQLQQLDLTNNGLTGPLPPKLGDLSNLQTLILRSNQLSGPLPLDLGNLAQLQTLNLSDNYSLTGPIPPALGRLLNLVSLNLSGCRLSGTIPAALANLTNLLELNLYYNQLTGSIPPELGNLTRLEQLLLNSNDLSGPIPPELGNLTQLRTLDMSGNDLSGSLPAALGSLANLEWLWLPNNALSGQIPPEFGKLNSLQSLKMGDNQLSGPLPASFGNLTSLQELSLTYNQLNGSLPPELGNLGSLQILALSNNQFSGSIPTELGNLADLNYLHLQNNQFTGPIPPALGNLANLYDLNLIANHLSGSIPAELGDLAQLVWLKLYGNQLRGLIPLQLANLTNLGEIYLEYNALTAIDLRVIRFLERKYSYWYDTQTVPPTAIQISERSGDQMTVTWAPIAFTGNADTGITGYYEISYATQPTGPFTVYGVTADKRTAIYTLTGLAPETTYYIRLRTYTPAHTDNPNDLWSDYSNVVSDAIDNNLLANGSFENGTQPWHVYTNGQGSLTTTDLAYVGNATAQVTILQTGDNTQLNQTGFLLEPKTRYLLSFAAKSNTGHDLSVYIHQDSSPYTNYGVRNFRVNLTPTWKVFTIEFKSKGFTAPTTDTRLRFWLAPFDAAGDVYWFDNISLMKVTPTVTAATATTTVTGEVFGNVQDVSEPVIVTLVDLESAGAVYQVSTTTDANGAFYVGNIPAGNYELRATPLAGMLEPEPYQFTVSETSNEPMIFVMEPIVSTIYLPTISQ